MPAVIGVPIKCLNSANNICAIIRNCGFLRKIKHCDFQNAFGSFILYKCRTSLQFLHKQNHEITYIFLNIIVRLNTELCFELQFMCVCYFIIYCTAGRVYIIHMHAAQQHNQKSQSSNCFLSLKWAFNGVFITPLEQCKGITNLHPCLHAVLINGCASLRAVFGIAAAPSESQNYEITRL